MQLTDWRCAGNMRHLDTGAVMPNDRRFVQLSRNLEQRARVMTQRLPKKAGVPLADDLAQSVLERLISAYGTAEMDTWSTEKLYGYAYQTLHRLVMDCAAKKTEWLADSLDSGDDPPLVHQAVSDDPSTEEKIEAQQDLVAVRALLDKLNAQERQFVLLTLDLGSAPEAQKTLGWPPGSASNACHRGAKLMRQLMAWAANSP